MMDIRSNNPVATNTMVNRNRRRWTLVGGVVAVGCLTFAVGAVVANNTSEQANQSLEADGSEVDGPAVVDIAERPVDVPVATSAPASLVDADGSEVEGPTDTSDELSINGFDNGALVEPGTYEISALGTPLTLSFETGWLASLNIPGHTWFSYRDSIDGGDPSVIFMRPHLLTDPRRPQALGVTPWPLDDIRGWLDEVVDGIIITDPQQVKIGGRDSIYFEAEITDPAVCGTASFCAGFIANTYKPGPENGGEGIISGWAFNPGLHDRIWWVEQGTEAPLVIIAQTASTDRGFQSTADVLLDTLTIGDPQPHPVPFEGSGLAG